MAKLKLPHRKHRLKPLPPPLPPPPPDKPENTAAKEPGYFPGSRFSKDELDFIKAVDGYRRKHRSKFLSVVDHLRVAQQLGYRLPDVAAQPVASAPRDAAATIALMRKLGFRFIAKRTGGLEFVPPPGAEGRPDLEALLETIAWGRAWLVPHAIKYAAPEPWECSYVPPVKSAQECLDRLRSLGHKFYLTAEGNVQVRHPLALPPDSAVQMDACAEYLAAHWTTFMEFVRQGLVSGRLKEKRKRRGRR